MEETIIVIMLKNSETGFLENEIGSYKISENENLIYNVFALEEENTVKTHMKLTVNRELEDWEFSAVFDYYDQGVFDELDLEIKEDDTGYDPIWEVIFDFTDNVTEMEDTISRILKIHAAELKEVFEEIADLKDAYSE